MKKVILILIFFVVVLGFSDTVIAQNSCPVLNGSQLLQCAGSGNCVNDLSLCPPPPSFPSSTDPGGATTGQSCTGNFRFDKAEADRCAKLAEAQGKARGYNITCTVTPRPEFKIVNANIVGTQSDSFYGDCTVNGVPGFSPENLAGYNSPNDPGYLRWDPFLGKYIRVFGSGYNLNSGWLGLPCSLADAVSSTASGGVFGGSLVGASSCTAGATKFFGSGSPGNWNAQNAQKIKSGGASGVGGAGGGGISNTPASNPLSGWYYRSFSYSSIDREDPLTSVEPADSTLACTGHETTANCHPEWGGGSLCSVSMMSGACRPERVNPYAAAALARAAVAAGKQRGYTTICSARYVPYRFGADINTGLNYHYDIKCAINSTTGIDAESMLNSNFPWTQYATRQTSRPSGGNINPATPACSLTATCNIAGAVTAGAIPSYLYNFTMDKASYCVGEKPKYTLTGGSILIGAKILWSSLLNNLSTQELDSNYGYVFQNQGGQAYWSQDGNPWLASHVGKWKKTANVNNILKSVDFDVTAICPLACSPKTQTRNALYSVASWTATFGDKTFSAIYNWSAPGSTKTSGSGRDFGTSYAQSGTYNVTVTSEGQSDTCQIVISG